MLLTYSGPKNHKTIITTTHTIIIMDLRNVLRANGNTKTKISSPIDSIFL